MTDAPEAREGVNDVERIEIAPSAPDAEDVNDDPEQPTNAPEQNADPDGEKSPEGKEEQVVHRQEPSPDDPSANNAEPAQPAVDGLKDIPGETPRERALRAEVTRLRNSRKGEMKDELFQKPAAPETQQPSQLGDKSQALLEKYNPEEIATLREVLPVLAEEMGYVRNDQLQVQTYTEQANNELDSFLTEHPEYLPENDTDGTLWNQFRAEYSLYNQPKNPRDLKKIFNRVHTGIFGIQTKKNDGAVEAQRHNVDVASHGGNSGPTAPTSQPKPVQPSAKPNSNLRLDMLKGFSEDEIKELSQ